MFIKYCTRFLSLSLMITCLLTSSCITNLKDYDYLVRLLADNKIDDFYAKVQEENLGLVTRYFEAKAKSGSNFNYGILVNAGIASPSNQSVFKPDLIDIDSFSDVPNESKCFMNAALYSIANSSSFDGFLEVDKLYKKLWEKRSQETVELANQLLRTLRELIYEIRRGQNTTPATISFFRKRHVDRFEPLNDYLMAKVYVELIHSYEFENGEFLDVEGGKTDHGFKTFDKKIIFADMDSKDINAAVANFQAAGKSYGPLGALSRCLRGGQDVIYLDSIFTIIDPFGKTARYMAFSMFKNTFNESDLKTYNPYFPSLVLDYDKDFRVRFSYNGKHITNIDVRFLRDANAVEIGRISRYASLIDPEFQLIAKTKHSSNHQNAELFRYARDQWERHGFFGPPTFSSQESVKDDGTYKDHLYFYEKNLFGVK